MGSAACREDAWDCLASDSSEEILDSRTGMILCAAAGWVCSDEDGSIADSSWIERDTSPLE